MVHVERKTLVEWRESVASFFEDYKAQLKKVKSVNDSINSGDMWGDPTKAFIDAYENVESFLEVEVPNYFQKTIDFLEEKITGFDNTLDDMVANTSYGGY